MKLNCDLEKGGCMFLEWRLIKLYYWLLFVFIKVKFVGCIKVCNILFILFCFILVKL